MSASTSRNKLKYRQFDIDTVYPIGTFYVQFPGAYNTEGKSNTLSIAFPTASEPTALFGGTWSEVFSDEGAFFRARGTAYQDEDRDDGYQTSQYASHNHGMGSSAYWFTYWDGNLDNVWQPGAGNIHRSTNGYRALFAANGGNETRVQNRLMKIWKRTS